MSYFKTMIAALFLALAVARVPAQQPLFLHATGNGAPGTITFDVHGNPNASFLIVPATGLQPMTLAGLEVHGDLAFLGLSCGLGLCGGLDANGEATLTVPVPASIVGGTWFFQAFEYAPALSASNWESLTFEAAPEPKEFLELIGRHNDAYTVSGPLYSGGVDAFVTRVLGG